MTKSDRWWFRFVAVLLSMNLWADTATKVASGSILDLVILVPACFLLGHFLADTWRLTREPEEQT